MHETPRQSDQYSSDHGAPEAVGMPFGSAVSDTTGLVPSSESALRHVPSETEVSGTQHEQATPGSWTVHDQSSDPQQVYDDLLDFNMDWFNHPGDFHIYATHEEGTENPVPRLAIRVVDGEVRDVCGRNGVYDLEMQSQPDVLEYIGQMPGGEKYVQAAADIETKHSIEQKMSVSLDAALTDTEVRFLYEINHEADTPDADQTERDWFENRRYERGGSDRVALARLYEQSIGEQFDTARQAYENVAVALTRTPDGLRHNLLADSEIRELFVAQQQQWHDNGMYAHIAARRLVTSARTQYDLVITPDCTVTRTGLIQLVQEFGQQIGEQPFIHELFTDGVYSDAELSGGTGDAPLRFSLAARHVDEQTGYASPNQQRRYLRRLQEVYPTVGYHVPSALEAVCSWYTLAAQGVLRDDTQLLTVHFDLPPPAIVAMQQGLLYTALNGMVPEIGFTRAQYIDHTMRLFIG